MKKTANLYNESWVREKYLTESTAQIAEGLGCDPTTVQKALARFNIKIKSTVRLKKLEDVGWLREVYGKMTIGEIMETVGCSRNAIWKALIRHGIDRHGRADHKRISILWDRDRLQELSEKHTVREIAAMFNCSDRATLRAFGRFGIKTNTGRVPKPRAIISTRSERKPNGRTSVPEHRLVMEGKIGRRLLPTEHVHHLDENPTNNSIENLIILTNEEHTSYHSSDRKIPFICSICGTNGIGGAYVNKYCDSCRKDVKKAAWTKYNHTRRTLKTQPSTH